MEGQNDDGGELSDGPRELDLYSRIDHENVIGLIAAGKRPPEFFFVMPFMRFGTLSELVHGERWQPEWHAVAKHMAEVAKGMEYLHSHDIIHRDLKLDNIFLDEVSALIANGRTHLRRPYMQREILAGEASEDW